MNRCILLLAIVFSVNSAVLAEDIYNCNGTFRNNPCSANPSKPIQFEKRYSKTQMNTSSALNDQARARYDFKRQEVLNELMDKRPLDTSPSQEIELQQLANQTKDLNDSLNRDLENRGQQLVYGDMVRIRTRLQSICSQTTIVNDTSSRSTCNRSLQELAIIEQKVSNRN